MLCLGRDLLRFYVCFSKEYNYKTNCAKRHFRSYVTEIDPVCLFVCVLFVSLSESAFRPRKYRLAEAMVGFGGPAKK